MLEVKNHQMLHVKKHGVVLERTDHDFESEGVLNPGCIQLGDEVHMYYRAFKEGNISTIGYCKLANALDVVERRDSPVLDREGKYEAQGVEDPRVVQLEDGKFYMAYTAFDGHKAIGCMAVSNDLIHWERIGIVTPRLRHDFFINLMLGNYQPDENCFDYYRTFRKYVWREEENNKVYIWDKDVILFPRKINGKFALLHRIFPDIQLVCFDNFEDLTYDFWEDYFKDVTKNIVLKSAKQYDSSYLGGGCPPIETEDGWVMIYHGVEERFGKRVYHAGAALLDLENPSKEIARLDYPLFSPDREWELSGYVNNVVFPTGHAIFGDELFVYYGAADKRIGAASMSFKGLREELNRARKSR